MFVGGRCCCYQIRVPAETRATPTALFLLVVAPTVYCFLVLMRSIHVHLTVRSWIIDLLLSNGISTSIVYARDAMVRTQRRCLRELLVDFVIPRKSKISSHLRYFCCEWPYVNFQPMLTHYFVTSLFLLSFHSTDTSFYFNSKEAVSHNEATISTSSTWSWPC